MSPDELGPLFSPAPGVTHLWVRSILLLITLPAAGILVLGLLRGRLGLKSAWSGIVILPLFAFTLEHSVFLQDAKHVEFCGSCHEMKPIVASLAADDGSLAARHFALGALPSSEACYVCHSGYGVWGGLRAKAQGLGHMVRSATGTARFPLELYEPYDIRGCLDCHAHTTRFRAEGVHRMPGIQTTLLSREIGCTGSCHPAAHPIAALRGGRAP